LFRKEKNTFFFLPYLKISKNGRWIFKDEATTSFILILEKRRVYPPFLDKNTATEKSGTGKRGVKPLVKRGFYKLMED
jgi:hypothetical protein